MTTVPSLSDSRPDAESAYTGTSITDSSLARTVGRGARLDQTLDARARIVPVFSPIVTLPRYVVLVVPDVVFDGLEGDDPPHETHSVTRATKHAAFGAEDIDDM